MTGVLCTVIDILKVPYAKHKNYKIEAPDRVCGKKKETLRKPWNNIAVSCPGAVLIVDCKMGRYNM